MDKLKQLTGGDSLQVEKKFQPFFNFRNTAKLIFVTNEIPKPHDKTDAFYRRVHIIHFQNVFDGSNADRYLMDKISQEEMEGLAFKCIGIAQGMQHRGLSFTNDQATESMREQYENDSNPFDVFISETYEEDFDQFVSKTKFKEKFHQWLKKHGYRENRRNDKRIKAAMQDKGYYYQTEDRRCKGKLLDRLERKKGYMRSKCAVKGVKGVKGVHGSIINHTSVYIVHQLWCPLKTAYIIHISLVLT